MPSIEKEGLEKMISEVVDKKLSEQRNYSHYQPFAVKESGDKTTVTYEAAKPPTNEYDVEIAKLEFEEWKMGRPGRTILGVGLILSLGFIGGAILLYNKSKN